MISNIDVDSLVRTEDLGRQFNFEEIRPTCIGLIKLFRKLSKCDLKILPLKTLQLLSQASANAASRLKEIKEFSPNSNQNPIDERRTRMNQIRSSYQEVFTVAMPIIGFTETTDSMLESFKKEGEDILNQLRKTAQTTLELQKASEKEAQEIVQTLRTTAAEGGVEKHASHFMEQATEHSNLATRWLIATILVAVITLGWGITSLFLHPYSTTSSNSMMPDSNTATNNSSVNKSDTGWD